MKKLILTLFAVNALWATDPYCPGYPMPQRELDNAARERDISFNSFSKRASKVRTKAAIDRVNLIDAGIFGKMDADGVPSAPLSTDEEFLRRVYVDLTGRIPTVEQAGKFLSDDNPSKRQALIDELMASDAFVDQWSFFYSNLFEITSRYYNYVSVQGRNRFNQYLRDFISKDRSYADVAREIISASGDAHLSGPPNFLVRGFQQGDPIQDTWDTLTDRTTVRFLGMKSECISCHDGRRHLDEINLYLTKRKRQEFWGMSAFFSRMEIQQTPLDSYSRQIRNVIFDRSNGGYYSLVNSGSPGPRPARTGGPYEPVYVFNGQKPQSNDWRKELGKMVTADRQFARTAVNYIWAAMYGQGIVDPVDGWDLARLDPNNPPPAPWTIQPSHPELMESLADEFVRGNYSVKKLIRLIASSSSYQLSSQHPGPWRPEYDRYFARHYTRRLTAEQIYDAMSIATGTETPMAVEGFALPVMYANQLPDPTEPRNDGNIRNFLSNFGRGDWWQNPRTFTSTVLQVLFVMNDTTVNYRTFANRDGGRPTRVATLLESGISDRLAIEQLFLATLTRFPSDDEIDSIMKTRTGNREQWMADVQWALLNKLDFVFHH